MYRSRSSFINTLFSMLSNSTLEPYLRWNDTGTEFHIINLLEFELRILPEYYPGMNFFSFMKKLKKFEFMKKTLNHTIIFSNPNFQQSKSFLLSKIRNVNGIPSRKKNSQSDRMMIKIAVLESAHIRMEETVMNLEKKYQKIIDLNQFLLQELRSPLNHDEKQLGKMLELTKFRFNSE